MQVFILGLLLLACVRRLLRWDRSFVGSKARAPE